MDFKKIYYSDEKLRENKDQLPKENLLTFLGYTREEEDRTKTSTSGGETTLTYKGYGTYEVGKNPTFYYSSNYCRAVYTAPENYTPRQKELMYSLYWKIKNKYVKKEFLDLGLGDRKFDPISAPYLPVSVEDYYKRKVDISNFVVLCMFGIIIGPLIMLAGFFVGDSHFICGGLVCLICSVLGCFILGMIRSKRTPYAYLSQEKKEQYREEYLRHIVKIYGSDAGAILQKFAIESGYDKI